MRNPPVKSAASSAWADVAANTSRPATSRRTIPGLWPFSPETPHCCPPRARLGAPCHVVRAGILESSLASVHGRDLALERLVDKAARRGYAIAWDLLRDRAEAEDAVQEALARACAEYARLRDAAALEGWFFRVLSNVCLRALRRRRLARVFGWLWPAEPRTRE